MWSRLLDVANLPLAALWGARVWYFLPLLVVISFVYAATRHELAGPILAQAWHTAVWIVGFMVVVFVALLALTLWV